MIEMQPRSDAQLLRDYSELGKESAFAEIVARHTDLVYSAALRQVYSPDLARDVAQSVFTDLARKARSLCVGLNAEASLVGWLYRATRFAARDLYRNETRRIQRERLAMEQLHPESASAPDWNQLSACLDDAMSDLDNFDREIVLLRYFKNHDLRTVGAALGISDDAAQKRVSRAVDRLREIFAKRGITIGAGGLAAVISANAVQAAPVGFALAISAAALVTGTSLATTATVSATKVLAMTALQKILATATIAVLAGAGIYEARRASRLRHDVRTLQQQQTESSEQIQQLSRERDEAARRLALLAAKPAPHLPAPSMPTSGAVLPPENLATKLLRGDETPRLTAEQTSRYLAENRRNATSLLAAYRTSGDAALLQEAMEKYPNDPQVAYEALFKADVSPEERRRWLETLKQNAPENALANYMSASDYFKSGQTDQAVQELIAASGKSGFQDYTVDRWYADEEAYRSAGYSEAETRMAATWGLTLPQLKELKQLGLSVVDLATAYRSAGDAASAQAALEIAIRMGKQFDGSTGTAGVPLVTQLVGIALQQMALKAMDPTAAYGAGTVQEQLEHLAQQQQGISDLVKQSNPLHSKMTPQDWINYNDRIRIFGEQNAIGWLLNKYGQN